MPIVLPILYKDDPKGLRAAEKRLQKFSQNVGRVAAAGFAVAGAAAVAFGVQSVRAFAEAERAQLELQFAFEKFPKLADTNVEALNRLNQALMKKTRFDDDAIASAQGLLAQYELTGKQIQELTPLLLDYAARTGRDLPSAAEALGKAMLGQGRALKEVGIDFEDAGSLAGNFDQIMAGLREQVGGFAEKDATTAAGKLEMLRNRFGEVQEKIGEALMPALDSLLKWVEGDGLRALEQFADWFAEDGVIALTGFIDKISEMAENGSLVPNIVAGIGAITAAQWGLNAAMAANPVGLVIAGIVALGALGVAIVANWNSISKVIFSVTSGITKGIGQMVLGVATGVQNAVNAVLSGLRILIGPINALLKMLGFSGVSLPSSVNFTNSLSTFVSRLGQVADAGAVGGTDYLFGGNFGGGSGQSVGVPGANRRMARGGLVSGPQRVLIGEGGPEVVAPYDQFVESLGMGRGGASVTINVTAGLGVDGVAVGREIVKAIKRYERASGPVFAGA